MKSVIDACLPRPEILAGTFNPEIFTASLSPIIDNYRGNGGKIDNIYTQAELFFTKATYPTQGLRTTLREVFGRIAGDTTVPAIHRLETAFGGGKTHTLIACTHIAYRGTELNGITDGLLPAELLPNPNAVTVVGVAGDEIAVHKPRGKTLIPYTLWGEIAYQIGGSELYQEVEEDAASHAAPGRNYFDTIFKKRKALIMLDELAQYAARLEAARNDGSNQLAAFLMGLHGYARTHPGIAIIVTLASATDAFGKQTDLLTKLVGNARGEQITNGDAIGIGKKALKGVSSVVARDAVQITPVQAAEISSVLVKRLFLSVDRGIAMEVASEYKNMYARNASSLPEDASRENYRDRMVANYPFHPSLVDFLNNKLANAENFQGTRGVLRVLSLAVRNIWRQRYKAPMIHTCHLDLRSERVVDEILGRTGSSDLIFVLNADIGSVDTAGLAGGQSNAELADQRNPHPEGYPLYEYTWKTVFLHSLVGRGGGIDSKVFGVTESEAMLSISFPGLTPPQVHTALEEINESAFYLRYKQGKYFAHDEPTINSILARIRDTLSPNDIDSLLEASARKIITGISDPFKIEYDVSLPEHLPDGGGKPLLGVVSLTADSLDIQEMIYTKGSNMAREQQNLIFLLVPETVQVELEEEQQNMSDITGDRANEAKSRIELIARQVKAYRILAENPQNYGVNPKRLEDDDFKKRQREREHSLGTAVASIYTRLYYSSTAGYIMKKEIRTAGGEGGMPFIQEIVDMLVKDKELLTVQSITKADLLNLRNLFFSGMDTVPLDKLRDNFTNLRNWPVLETTGLFEQIIRLGVQKGIWALFCIKNENSIKPDELYHQNNEIPLGINLFAGSYILITSQGAQKRGWGESGTIDTRKIRDQVEYAIKNKGITTVGQIIDEIKEELGEIQGQDIENIITELIKSENLYLFHGKTEQMEKPDLIKGAGAALYSPRLDDVLITPSEASIRGWVTEKNRTLRLQGIEGTNKVLPLLGRLGSIYSRGAKTTISDMDVANIQLPLGGVIRIQLSDITPESMKSLGELFEVLDGIVSRGRGSEVYLYIKNLDGDCPFIKELTKDQKGIGYEK